MLWVHQHRGKTTTHIQGTLTWGLSLLLVLTGSKSESKVIADRLSSPWKRCIQGHWKALLEFPSPICKLPVPAPATGPSTCHATACDILILQRPVYPDSQTGGLGAGDAALEKYMLIKHEDPNSIQCWGRNRRIIGAQWPTRPAYCVHLRPV